MCDCKYRCTLDVGMMCLTGHQENCEHRGNDKETLRKLVTDLVRGMEAWAADEDNAIHDDAWAAYKRGKSLLVEPVEKGQQ